MAEIRSFRLRLLLFFLLVGLGAIVVIGVAMWLAAHRLGGGVWPPLVLFGGGAGFAVLGMVMWVWLKLDENVARPIERLVNDLRAVAHGRAARRIDPCAGRYLGDLATAAREATDALIAARSDVDQAIRDAIVQVERQKNRLEAVLRDLEQGVLICTLDHKILLYNHHALQILHVAGDIGLGRSLFEVVSAPPFRHALERLTVRRGEAWRRDRGEGLSVPVVCSTVDGRHTLRGRVALFLDSDRSTPMGYVVIFGDATRELADHAGRERLLHAATAELRRPAASLLATAEMLRSGVGLDAGRRREFERILVEEATSLSGRLRQIEAESHDFLAGAWPMSDVLSTTLFQCVVGKRGGGGVACRIAGQPVWLHCDSLTIVELLDHAITGIAEIADAGTVTLRAVPNGATVYLDVLWRGRVVPNAALDRWLATPLGDDLGAMTGRDILDRHGSELWCEAVGRDGARLRMPLPSAKERHGAIEVGRRPLPERPEFYDFDLLGRIDPSTIDDVLLGALTYVVFDTETTGLEPSGGDEIVSIAGIRIVNGRILHGETFDQLVNPARPIPATATEVHGITAAMVASAPPINEVLPQFRKFVGDAVLVAHNAAFDMKFLTLKQDACGVRFNNPVLDTVLLAALVQGTADSLTLDALAARYGVALSEWDRHSALGDSVATAEVFLRLIDLLETVHVRTLRDAVAASRKMVTIRRRQAVY